MSAPDGRSEPAGDGSRRGWFVLRLWHEPGDGWRGQVTHVQTGARVFFRHQAPLWRFLRAALRLQPGDAFLEADQIDEPSSRGRHP